MRPWAQFNLERVPVTFVLKSPTEIIVITKPQTVGEHSETFTVCRKQIIGMFITRSEQK